MDKLYTQLRRYTELHTNPEGCRIITAALMDMGYDVVRHNPGTWIKDCKIKQ